MKTYDDFLAGKLIEAKPSGFEITSIPDEAFDWQKSVIKWAGKTGRAALFEDCGLGKTLQQLAYAAEAAKYGDVIILAPLAVAQQTVREGAKFGIPVHQAESQADVTRGINITNYEKLKRFDTSKFIGVVLDESSILKSYMGGTKRAIVEAFRDTPYRLAATATPAPNDLMELLNHAEFLGIMRSSEALSIWFTADQNQSGKYRLKGHAAADFWRWVASWAVCISKPSDIGYSDTGYELPPMTETDVVVRVSELSDDWTNGMFRDIDMSATGFHAEKRRTLKQRCEKAAEIAMSTDEQTVIWTFQNDEADELKRLLPDAVEVRGAHTAEHKERAALGFIDGTSRVLISKPSIFGFGLNFQNCRNVIFNGLDYSFESYYQAVRRFYRFGQHRPVNVWRVIGSTEQNILGVLDAKQRQKQEMEYGMARAMREFQTETVRGRGYKLSLEPQRIKPPEWLREAV